jgi:cytoskeletal protein CcmA (bactofilin family)
VHDDILAISNAGCAMFSANTTQSSPRMGAAPSIVSSDVTITGLLASDGDMQVDGRVDGDVRCVRLVVGESGAIKGEVTAEFVTVRGRIEGGIRARELALAATARVEGEILHTTLEVEAGAMVLGRFRHSADPLAEALPDSAPERRRSGSPMRAVKSPAEDAPLRAAG